MDPIQKRELKRQAWMRLAAQRRRAGVLRGRVVVVSLICFALLWGIVFAQMATGNDPVLAGQEKASTTHAVASARREVETTDPREIEPGRQTDSAEGEEEFFEEPEFVEETEAVEEEPELVEEAEPEIFEAEEEPLVTSQS